MYDYNGGVVKVGKVGVDVPIAQGDILLVRRSKMPEGLESMKVGAKGNESAYYGRSAVLAYGEATGHSHCLEVAEAETTIEAFHNKEGKMFLKIDGGPATLKHEEHAHIEVPPGIYERVLQRENDQFAESRRVSD